MQQADVVFQGVTVQVEEVEFSPGFEVIKATFDVVRVWKGPVASELVVYTDLEVSVCAFGFLVGEDYIVYAVRALARHSDELYTGVPPKNSVLLDS